MIQANGSQSVFLLLIDAAVNAKAVAADARLVIVSYDGGLYLKIRWKSWIASSGIHQVLRVEVLTLLPHWCMATVCCHT